MRLSFFFHLYQFRYFKLKVRESPSQTILSNNVISYKARSSQVGWALRLVISSPTMTSRTQVVFFCLPSIEPVPLQHNSHCGDNMAPPLTLQQGYMPPFREREREKERERVCRRKECHNDGMSHLFWTKLD